MSAAAGALGRGDLAADWAGQLRRWLEEAKASGLFSEPTAMVLATASAAGFPSARTVLLKELTPAGLVFYTNLHSRKGQELAANPRACAVFPWYSMHRQVVVAGSCAELDRPAVAAYFATRPWGSQVSAWASPQSQVVADRTELDRRWAEAAARFPSGSPVPLPAGWGGFRLAPDRVEFWQGRVNRLHDRFRYRADASGEWFVERLAP